MVLSRVGRATCLLWLAFIAGCATAFHPIPVDPNVDFAAHVEHRGLVVDQMQGASPAVLEPAGWRHLAGGPRFLLEASGMTLAALWFPDANRMIVRESADPSSPLIGEVDAAWKAGAIRLTFKPATGATFQTGQFDRVDGRFATVALSSDASTVLDVCGVYRAEVRDTMGTPVGWLRAQISPYQPATRIYDGVLPAAVDGPLAAAAVAVLDNDVTFIEDHALNVYLGN